MAGLYRCGSSRPPPEFDPRTVQPIASRYTDYATRPINVHEARLIWSWLTAILAWFCKCTSKQCHYTGCGGQVSSAQNNSPPTGRIFHEISHRCIFLKSVGKIHIWLKYSRNKEYFNENLRKCTMSRRILLRMINSLHRSCMDNQNTHFVLNNFFPKIMPFMRQCGKMPQRRTGHRWHITAHVLSTLDSYGVILVAFPRQEWLRERTWMLRYTDTACPVSV